jgi:16S rRNA (uracil1498-N3)-methyltransferase
MVCVYNKISILSNKNNMRTIRAFFADISSTMSEVAITNDHYNYFKNVLRLKKNDNIVLFNNLDGLEYNTEIISITNKAIELNITNSIKIDNENAYTVNFYQSLIKIENFELVIQKATELGVNNIYPIITDYTNLKFDFKNIEKKLDRWQKIAVGASEQSRRVFVPKIHAPIELETLSMPKNQFNITLCPYAKNDTSFQYKLKIADNINIFIGPEGGFSETEMKLFKNNDFETINLGKRILKAETAPINIISIINFLKQ